MRILFFLYTIQSVLSFVPCSIYSPPADLTPTKSTTSFSSSASDEERNYRSDLDSMRRILEQSWNQDHMGSVPTSSESAAEAATESILSALNNADKSTVLMIDISLPSLDPMSGNNIYDDVGAVQFCSELAKNIHKDRERRVAIVVKDENLVRRATRVLGGTKTQEVQVEYFDDFADLGVTTGFENEGQEIEEQKKEEQTNEIRNEPYRIGSLLGDSDVPTGRNMINDVVSLVAKNAVPASEAKEEDVILILAPISQADLIGVRWLVSKYGGSKTIVIVNNRLNPLPRELMESETIYSVLPLIARSVQPTAQADSNPSPKVVILRRYPEAWQIHVDDSKSGLGFELVHEIPASAVGIKGPSFEYISSRVKEYMQLKFGGGM